MQRPGAPGTDPQPRIPPREEPPAALGAAAPDSDNAPSFSPNDEQLRRDVPPHW